MPKILVLSDLHWTEASRQITFEDNIALRKNAMVPQEQKFDRLKKYAQIIVDTAPEIVLFAGDVTGDGSCGHGFHKAFSYLLEMLNLLNIHAIYIQGDHDEQQYMDYLDEHIQELEYVHHISGIAATVSGINILGLSYYHTHDKIWLKEYLNEEKRQFDIVLSHAELKRRTWLLELNPQWLITGHYDHKCTRISNSNFLSFGNDFTFISYAIFNTAHIDQMFYGLKSFNSSFHYRISTSKQDQGLSYQINNQRTNSQLSLLEMAKNVGIDQIQRLNEFTFEAIQGAEFKSGLEQLFKYKQLLKASPDNWDSKMISSLRKLQVSKRQKISWTLIKDYLEDLAVKVK